MLAPPSTFLGEAGNSHASFVMLAGHEVVFDLFHLIYNTVHVGQVCLVAEITLHL